MPFGEPLCTWTNRPEVVPAVFQKVQLSDIFYRTLSPMKKKDLTLKLVLTVPCPTCGVAPGQRCVLYSGAQRTGPHVNRKLSAAGAIEVEKKSSS